ncbi:MAG: hypothetical protein ACLPY5_08545 [Candidatus Bathyarchaeia archaeon]
MTAIISEKESLGSDLPVETLKSEIIMACIEQWRSFKPSNRNKTTVINLGAKIFDMLVKYKSSQRTTPHVTQGPVSETNVIAAFVDTLPLKLRNQVLAYVRKQI